MKSYIFTLLLCVLCALCGQRNASAAEKLKALIVDGQNNHKVWPKSTIMMRQYLMDTGLFENVDVARTKFLWRGEEHEEFLALANAGEGSFEKQPKTDPDFKPDFAKYDLVVSNFGWKAANWPPETRQAFEKFVAAGGGFVAVHAADNSWPLWREYNRMIGLGGWGDRTEKAGPYVYFDADGKIVRDTSPGKAGKHGKANAFLVTTRNANHPITKGLPETWRHATDECYSFLRGPAENMTVLATAADTGELQAAGRNEPMLMAIDYEKGRVFHTTLGHDTEAFESVGFIVTFQRGAEWAATGKVTQEIPEDFPGTDTPSTRTFSLADPPTESLNGLPLVFSEDFEEGRDRWEVTDEKSWTHREVEGNHVFGINNRKNDYKPAFRSPHHIALIKDLEVADFVITFRVRSTKDTGNHRDCCVFFNHQDAQNFYYVHLGAKPDPHSGQIMIVKDAPRLAITKNEKPVPWTDAWHRVKLVRDTKKGTIEIYFDDMETPHMKATDKTFGVGRIGLGSFDDMNDFDDIRIYGR